MSPTNDDTRHAVHLLIEMLADRVYFWSLGQEQHEDWRALTFARMAGWQPWHERGERKPETPE